jgi:hypothetical protein
MIRYETREKKKKYRKTAPGFRPAAASSSGTRKMKASGASCALGKASP